jgi:membrane-bound lytic murein transglycosylase D
VIWSKANNKISNNRQLIRQLSYQVKHGDSLSRIAQKFNLRITDIESWNGINRARYLQPGQSLKLFVNVTQTRL